MFDIVHYDTIDSTNEEAKRRLLAGQVSRPLIITADTQSAGKGSRGRTWVSPPGAGLYFSVVHPEPGRLSLQRPEHQIPGSREWSFDPFVVETQADWSICTRAAGLACAEILEEETDLRLSLKPVNDLYINHQKLGGILCEAVIRETRQGDAHCRGLVTGIGINMVSNVEITAFCESETRTVTEIPSTPGDSPVCLLAPNQPTSLEAHLPPTLFATWYHNNREFLRQTLCPSIARRVTDYYTLLWFSTGRSTILSGYDTYKLHG